MSCHLVGAVKPLPPTGSAGRGGAGWSPRPLTLRSFSPPYGHEEEKATCALWAWWQHFPLFIGRRSMP